MLGEIPRVRIADPDLDRIKRAMLTMPAHPDVADGLNRIAGQRLSSRDADKLTAHPREVPAHCRVPDS